MIHFLFCLGFWIVVFGLITNKMAKGLARAINHVKKMHQIPCASCTYFTNNYCLKCTIHPTEAMSEEAIYCRDFEINSKYKTSY